MLIAVCILSVEVHKPTQAQAQAQANLVTYFKLRWLAQANLASQSDNSRVTVTRRIEMDYF